MMEAVIEAAKGRVEQLAETGKQEQVVTLARKVGDLLTAIDEGSRIAIDGNRTTIFFGPETCSGLAAALDELAKFTPEPE